MKNIPGRAYEIPWKEANLLSLAIYYIPKKVFCMMMTKRSGMECGIKLARSSHLIIE